MATTSRTVLVIDNSPESLCRYQTDLTSESAFFYEILAEPYGNQVLQRYQAFPPDVILLGLEDLPTADFTLLDQLFSELGSQCPPIVVVGSQQVRVAVQAIKHGAADYLVRDQMTREDLHHTLRSAIENAELKRQLQLSQEKFQTSVENLMDCFGIYTAVRDDTGQILDFRIDYVNRAACENNHMTREQQVGKKLCEILPGHIDSGLFEAYCRLVETGEPVIKDSVVFEDSYGGARQLVRAFDIRATKLNDGFVASWRDITDRKRLELELSYTITSLQQEQQRLNQLIDQAPVGIGIGSSSGEVKVINDAMLQLYGLDRSTFEQQGMNWRSFIPTDRADQAERALGQLRQNGTLLPQEWEIVGSDGQRIPLWMSANQLTDDTHDHVAFAIDLTQLKQTQATLHGERQLRRALDSLFCFVGLMTSDGTLIDANRTALEAAGLSLDSVINRPFEETHWWSYSAQVQAELRQAISRAAQGQTVRYDVEVRLRNDQRITIDFSLVPLFDDQGRVEYLVPSGIDVTQRKQAEASLLQSQDQLQQQFAELENIYQSAPIGLNVLDRDLRFVRINQRLADINGVSAEDHIGRTVREVLPDLADAAEQMLRPILETGEPLLNVEIHGETPAQPGVERIWLEHFLPIKQGDQVLGINTVCQEITTQKQTELALRQVTERLNMALKTAPIVLFNQDRHLRYTWVYNPALDFSEASVLGRHDAELVDPETATYLTTLKQQVLDTGVSLREEVVIPHDGQTRYYDLTIDPIWDDQNNVIGITCAAVDISERVSTAAALLASEERLRLGMKVTGFALARFDYTTHQVELSPEAAQLYGLDPEQLVVSRQQLHATFHPDEQAELHQLIDQVLDPAGPGWFARDHRILWPNGEVRWLTVRKQVFFDTTGPSPRPSYGILAALDITQRKQAEKSLRRSEERYRNLFETMEDGFCVLEVIFDEAQTPVDYRFLELNPAFERHTGLHQAEGKTARELLPDLEEHWFEIYGQVALTGEPTRFENGSEVMNRWFEVYAFRLGGDTSRKVALLFKDISDRKAIDLQRERLLQQEQVAREAAERANRVKDEFLAILSHELRSPLNPILGWSKLLQTRQLDEAKTQKALSTIERNAKLQTQLIDDLLDVARILRGKLKLDHQPVNLTEVIEDALDTVRTTATTKSITLHFPSPILPTSPTVSGDSARLQQIVWNLLSNAIKFTPSGGRVEVRLELTEEARGEREAVVGEVPGVGSQVPGIGSQVPGIGSQVPGIGSQVPGTGYPVSGTQGQPILGTDIAPALDAQSLTSTHPSTHPPTHPSTQYARITVTDTGQGISPDFLPHIFESFRQEDVSITRRHGGLGLGLSIVRYLVEAHGGMITADSPGEGCGATFTVRLPLLITPSPQAATVSSSQDLSLTGTRVMAIDDEADARSILEAILTFHGAEVMMLDNAADLLTQLPVFRPEVLICDLGMPHTDGYNLIQQVRSLPPDQGGQTPAIALTAYAREEDKQRTLRNGYQRHIAKPFDLEELVRAVAQLAASSS
jgi:PAS domain S-box-containing protein